VVITCTSATRPYTGFVPYVISKGAAHQLVRTLAIELAPHVRVNAVAPGTVLAPEAYGAEQSEALAKKTLLERLGSPEDVARAVSYLADASFVTGHEILVDGGVALNGAMSGD
jgi:pteridine reductase